MTIKLNFDADALMEWVLQAASSRTFQIAEDIRREMGAEGSLIKIRRNLTPVRTGNSVSMFEIEVPAGHDALLQRFRKNLIARTRH